MARTYTFEVQSVVAATPAAVWQHATNMSRVNLELWPLARMTYPQQYQQLKPLLAQLQQRLFRSFILLFGVFPVDYYDITFEEFEPGHRFLERSPTLTQRVWQHERVIEASPGGTRVTDRVVFGPRILCLVPLYRGFVQSLFNMRHKNLRRLLGVGDSNV